MWEEWMYRIVYTNLGVDPLPDLAAVVVDQHRAVLLRLPYGD